MSTSTTATTASGSLVKFMRPQGLDAALAPPRFDFAQDAACRRCQEPGWATIDCDAWLCYCAPPPQHTLCHDCAESIAGRRCLADGVSKLLFQDGTERYAAEEYRQALKLFQDCAALATPLATTAAANANACKAALRRRAQSAGPGLSAFGPGSDGPGGRGGHHCGGGPGGSFGGGSFGSPGGPFGGGSYGSYGSYGGYHFGGGSYGSYGSYGYCAAYGTSWAQRIEGAELPSSPTPSRWATRLARHAELRGSPYARVRVRPGRDYRAERERAKASKASKASKVDGAQTPLTPRTPRMPTTVASPQPSASPHSPAKRRAVC